MSRSQTCRRAPTSESRRHVDRHRDPRRAPRPHSLPDGPVPTSDAEAFHTEVLASSKSTPTRGSRRRRIRSRRHRRRIRRARCPLPRRRSGRPRAHVVGHRREYAAFNRHELPATTPDSVYIDHRPLAIDRGELAASIRAALGRHAGRQHLHRGRASAERTRSSRHRGVERDLTRGL